LLRRRSIAIATRPATVAVAAPAVAETWEGTDALSGTPEGDALVGTTGDHTLDALSANDVIGGGTRPGGLR
jgi:hypothetical protein